MVEAAFDLVERCLRKEPKVRIQAMGDARIVLGEYLGNPDAVESSDFLPGVGSTASSTWKRALPWAAAAVLLLALIASVNDSSCVPGVQ